MKTIVRWICGLVPLAALLVFWQLNSTADALSFPEPSSWWTAGKALIDDGTLLPALRTTITTFFVSMLIASLLGVTAGVVIGFNPALERALTPLIDFFRTLPPPVIVPVLSLMLGLTMKASVTIVVLSVVWPILLNTITAVHEMPPTRREVARVLHLGRVETFRKVTMPSLFPGMVTSHLHRGRSIRSRGGDRRAGRGR